MPDMTAQQKALFDRIDSYVNCPTRPARQLLARHGFSPLAPGAIDDFCLRGRLWEFLYAMAGIRQFATFTEHLSDRELYQWLHDTWLKRKASDFPADAPTYSEVDVSADFEDLLPDWEEDPSAPWDAKLETRHERDAWLPRPVYNRFGTLVSNPLDEPADSPEELANWCRWVDLVLRQGGVFPPVTDLSEASVTAKLWELIAEFDRRNLTVRYTDHLSDAELYSRLCSDEFEVPADHGPKSGYVYIHSFLHDSPDPGRRTWLRYYATEAEWQAYVREHPGEAVPQREKLPYSRDWRMPQYPR